tara:strand:- start:1406 stop:3265 length:1860 start_codon:yes stop_codon:yes gene_type:complete
MKDIEELIIKQSDYNSLFKEINDNTIDYVKELCKMDYKKHSDYVDNVKVLRKKHKVSPSKPVINYIYDKLLEKDSDYSNEYVKKNIKGKGMRSQSGVIVISILTSPYPTYTNRSGIKKKQEFSCKHDCFYCPKEVDINGKDVNPRSYLSDEPAVARALQNDYDAIKQFNDRAYQYIINGHVVDKLEIIILGGTWSEYPIEYQEEYIRDVFYAANTFYNKNKRKKLSLLEEQSINENNKNCRIIGITLEMRPDSITENEIRRLRYLGCTRVQLGVQHINDNILKKINRGCKTIDAIKALKLLKDNGYKVDAHWMPDLPGSDPEEDTKMFDYIIESEDLQFDQWKIYPTTTVPWTKIKKWYDEGKYIPYTEKNPDDLINVLIDVKKKVHPWIRLNRVIRDIPNTTRSGDTYIYAGNKVTNLRQILGNKLKDEKKFCKCIRCREIKNNKHLKQNIQTIIRKYKSSNGIEYFISIESGNNIDSFYGTKTQKWYNSKFIEEPGIIYGFVRLRISNNSIFNELKNCALIRELHVYGEVVQSNNKHIQHNGYGKILMKKAENIALLNGYYKIAVISGIGVRNYYKRMGYYLENTYMIKNLLFDKFYNNFIIFMIFIIILELFNYTI